MKSFNAYICSPSQTLFEGQVLVATMESDSGIIQILPDHENMITKLNSGLLDLRTTDNQKIQFFINGGTAKIEANVLSIWGVEIAKLDNVSDITSYISKISEAKKEMSNTIQEAIQYGAEFKPTADLYLLEEERLAKFQLYQELTKGK